MLDVWGGARYEFSNAFSHVAKGTPHLSYDTPLYGLLCSEGDADGEADACGRWGTSSSSNVDGRGFVKQLQEQVVPQVGPVASASPLHLHPGPVNGPTVSAGIMLNNLIPPLSETLENVSGGSMYKGLLIWVRTWAAMNMKLS